MPPKKIIQSVSNLEKDPFSRPRKEDLAPEISSAELRDRNDNYNKLLYGAGDTVAEVNDSIDEVVDSSSLDNFYAKIANETESVYQQVLTLLSAQGMPESAINDSSKDNIRKRILLEVDRIAISGQETLDNDSAGGFILNGESRLQVIRSVVGEEIMDFNYESPEEAIETLPYETVESMYKHLPGGAAETRSNENLALLGLDIESNPIGLTLEDKVDEVINQAVEKEEGSLESEEEQILELYEDSGGDLGAKSRQLGIDDTALDEGMITRSGLDQEGGAIKRKESL